jgi:hypothetical protein
LGAYFVAYDLEKNTASKHIIDYKIKANEFHFYESDFGISKSVSEELFLVNKKLTVSFINAHTYTQSNITIVDDVAFHEKKC